MWDVAQWESIVCIAHRLQNAIKHAVDNQNMQRLLAKCHHLVGHIKHSALATDGLMRKQRALGFRKILHVIQETPTRWKYSTLSWCLPLMFGLCKAAETMIVQQ